MTCASCGAPLDAGTTACARCGAPSAPPTAPTYDPYAAGPPPGAPAPPGATPTDPYGPSRRSRGPLLAVLAAVVAVLGLGVVGWFVVQAVDDDGGGGGASSPEAAVQDLAVAVGEEDAIGVVSSLNPEEAGPLVELYQDLAERGEQLGVLDLDDDGAPPELQVDISELDLQVEELADGVARVDIVGGEASALLEAADQQLGGAMMGVQVPLVDFGLGSDPDGRLEGELTADELGDELFDGQDPFLVVVEEDGRWYVSPSYTVAEALAVANDWTERDYGASTASPPEGAESPEAAVQAMAEAIAGFDLEAGAQVLPPAEARWAQDHLQAIIDAIDPEAIDDELDELEPELEDLQLRVDEQGDGEAVVVIESVTFRYESEDDGTTTVELDGDCLTVQDDVEDEEQCLEEALEEDLTDPALADLVPDEQRVVVVEDDGRWFVSPVRTVVDYLGGALENLEDRQVEALGLLPPERIEVGSTIGAEATTGYTVDSYTFEAKADVLYVIDAQPEDEDDLVSVSREVVLVDEDGPVSFDVAAGADEPGDLSEDPFAYELSVEEATPDDEVVEVGDLVEGDFDGEGYVLLELDTGTSDEVQVTVEGDVVEGAVYDDLSFEEGYGPLSTALPGDPALLFPSGEPFLYLLLRAEDPDGEWAVSYDPSAADGPDEPGDPETPGVEQFDGPFDVQLSGELTEAAPTAEFELDGGGSCYDVTVVDADGELDPFLTVLDPSGQVEDEDDDGADSPLDSFLSFCTEPGEVGWTLEVSGFADDLGSFVVFVDEY